MTNSCLFSSSTGFLALEALLGYCFLTLPSTSPSFFLFEMIDDYSMYTQLPAGAVSIFGPPLWLFYPLNTPTTDNNITSPIDIKHPSSPMLPDIFPFSSDFALDQTNPCHLPLIFSWVPTNNENFSYVVYFLTGRCYNYKFPDPLSPSSLSTCDSGLYLDRQSAVLPLADNSSSLPDADPIISDPLPASALLGL